MAAIHPLRTLPRLPTSLLLRLPDGWVGEVLDLSATGLRVRSVAVLEPHTRLEGTLVLPGGAEVPLRVRVQWVSSPVLRGLVHSELGLALEDPPAAYHAALARLFADPPS